MRLALFLQLASLAIAGPVGVSAEEPRRSAPILDHRELRLFKRELADDLRDLRVLRARLRRLEALLAAKVVDARAVAELHARVHREMLKEALEHRLTSRPGLGEEARRRSPHPVTVPQGSRGPGVPRFFTAADEYRVAAITDEWAALQGRHSRPDLLARRALLAELIELGRVELEDDLQAFKEKGGDVEALKAELEEDQGEEEEAR